MDKLNSFHSQHMSIIIEWNIVFLEKSEYNHKSDQNQRGLKKTPTVNQEERRRK